MENSPVQKLHLLHIERLVHAEALRRHHASHEDEVEWPEDGSTLPRYVQIILDALCSSKSARELAEAKEKIKRDSDIQFESELVKMAESRIEYAKENEARMATRLDSVTDECTYLEFEVERAKGREEALHRAVERAYKQKYK